MNDLPARRTVPLQRPPQKSTNGRPHAQSERHLIASLDGRLAHLCPSCGGPSTRRGGSAGRPIPSGIPVKIAGQRRPRFARDETASRNAVARPRSSETVLTATVKQLEVSVSVPDAVVSR